MRRLLLTTALALGLGGAAQAGQGARIEVAFVLDTTGSMVDLIEGAKQKIWSITNTILDLHPDAEIEMALIAYRDRGDDYVVQSTPLSDDVQGLYGTLRKLEADGGGDGPESVNEALEAAVEKLDWSEGGQGRRVIFLVGDAPPHMDYPQGPRYAEVIAEAREKGIIINTVQAGADPETEEYWREMARLGGGRYVAIPQDGGQVVQIDTPFDAPILEVQRKIDATILPYGSLEEQASVTRKVETRAESSVSVQADNSSFYSKKKGGRREAVTGGGDLVSEVANGALRLEAVPEAELPPELQSLPTPERAARLEALSARRKALEAEMDGLVSQRDAYLAQAAATQPAKASFDGSVRALLAEQLR